MSQWSEWVDHDGNGCPVPPGTIVQAEGEHWDGRVERAKFVVQAPPQEPGYASAWNWSDFGRIVMSRQGDLVLMPRIVRYRRSDGYALVDAIVRHPQAFHISEDA